MSKLALPLAAACLAGLASCAPPEHVPPPKFRPHPSYAPQPVDPYSNPYDVSPPPVPAPQLSSPPPTATGGYPTATRTENPDQVISPYEPFNIIDISNPRIESGKLARDPTNKKIFRVP